MKKYIPFPVIDVSATGRNIRKLREGHHLSVADVQDFLGLESPQSIYHWQQGRCLPSIDHLYALSTLFDVTMNEIIIPFPPPRSTDQAPRKTCSLKNKLMILFAQASAA